MSSHAHTWAASAPRQLTSLIPWQAAAAPPAQHPLRMDSGAQPAEQRPRTGSSPAMDAGQPTARSRISDAHPAPLGNGSSSASEPASCSRPFDAELVARHWGEAWTLKRLDDGRRLVSWQPCSNLSAGNLLLLVGRPVAVRIASVCRAGGWPGCWAPAQRHVGAWAEGRPARLCRWALRPVPAADSCLRARH